MQWQRLEPRASGYSEVFWVTKPGGEIEAGFDIHNGGPVPVTIESVRLRYRYSGAIHDAVPGGALLGSGKDDRLKAHHPVTVGPGGSVSAALIVRVVCDPAAHRDASAPDPRSPGVWQAEATSPVVVRYKALGLSMSQTLTVGEPVIVAMYSSACK